MKMNKEKITLVLLPGLNGTAGLFDPLLSVIADGCEWMVIDYPTHEVKSYAELTEFVLDRISSIHGAFILLGESFSGPIAIMLSAKNIPGHIGTILVASFASAPYFSVTKYLPWGVIYRLARPLYFLRIKLSKAKNASLLSAASVEMQKVEPNVLAARTRAALSIDVTGELKTIKIPMIYFRANYDFIVPIWNMKKIIALKPDIKIIYFDTQHFLLQSVPHAAWKSISKFIHEIR